MGITIADFDAMTPREFSIYADAYNQNLELELERRQQEMYVSALLVSKFVMAKHIPKYDEIFRKDKEMTDDEMLATVRALNAQFGGSEVRNGSC